MHLWGVKSAYKVVAQAALQEGRAVAGIFELTKVAALPLVLFVISHMWTTQRAPSKVGAHKRCKDVVHGCRVRVAIAGICHTLRFCDCALL